jgi:hypothetical protein
MGEVDKSATGSVNFFWSESLPLAPLSSRSMMHLRPPSIAHGVVSFIWAVFFGLLIWLGGGFLGFNSAMSLIVGAVAGFLIFLFVRVYGEDEPGRP